MATVDLGNHKNRLSFMEKLTHILSSPFTDIVTWSSDGSSFIVKDLKRFSADVLPQYFRTSNAQSFQRQLNYYGFRKVTHVTDGGGKATVYEFRHDKFHRDALHLAKDIKRRVGVDVNQVKEQARSELDAMKTRCDALEREARKWKSMYEEAAAKLARLEAAPKSRKRARMDVGLTPMVMPGSSAAPFPSVPMPYDDMYEGEPDGDPPVATGAAAPAAATGSGSSTQPSEPPTSPPLSPSIDVDAMLNLTLDDAAAPPPPPPISGLPMARSASGFSIESFELDPTLGEIGDLTAAGAELAWFDQNPMSPPATAAPPAAVHAIPTKNDLQALPPEVQQRLVARLVAAMLGRYFQQSHTLAPAAIAPSPPTSTALVPVMPQTAVNQLESLVVSSPPEAFLQCLLQLPALQQLHLGAAMTAAPMAAAHG